MSLALAFASGELSAVEITRYTLARAHERSELVGVLVHICDEYALAQAASLDRLRAGGGPLPPLAGVPCPIKDLNAVSGLPYEAGSAAFRGNIASFDDSIAQKFRDAGTIMVGKTTTPEFGLPCYTEPEGYPAARTPFDLRRSAGGSSGGAAAAVADQIVPIAHASDGGGSIRIPASACGLVGLKASRGVIGSGIGRVSGPGLATDGVLGRSVLDVAAAMDAIRGNWDGDTFFCNVGDPFVSVLREPIRKLRVGLLLDPVIVADAPVAQVCLDAAISTAEQLSDLGHWVDIAPVPFPAERWSAFADLWSVMALSVPVPEGTESLLRPLTRRLRSLGHGVSGLQYATALASIQALTQEVAQNWAAYDLIVTPTLAQPPALVGELRNDADPDADFLAQSRFTPWTSVYNLTGRPAISLPLGWAEVDGSRLPIGVMLGGRVGADGLLLALGAQLGC